MNGVEAVRERLREQALFKSSDEKVLQLASAVARVSDFKSGAYVCFQGDTASPLIMVLSGHLRVCTLSEEGHEIPLLTVSAGEMTGAVSVINDSPLIGNIVATRKSTVAMLTRADARRLFREPEVANALNRSLAQLVGNFIGRHTERGMPRATARVSAWINSAISDTGNDALATIELPSHASLGAMMKASRETVSRVLAALERDGVLAKQGRRQISVLDRAALRAIATGSTNRCKAII